MVYFQKYNKDKSVKFDRHKVVLDVETAIGSEIYGDFKKNKRDITRNNNILIIVIQYASYTERKYFLWIISHFRNYRIVFSMEMGSRH